MSRIGRLLESVHCINEDGNSFNNTFKFDTDKWQKWSSKLKEKGFKITDTDKLGKQHNDLSLVYYDNKHVGTFNHKEGEFYTNFNVKEIEG